MPHTGSKASQGPAVRLRETIKDLRSQLQDLEASNRELAKNEGKYRARSQDLRERVNEAHAEIDQLRDAVCLLYTSPSPRD